MYESFFRLSPRPFAAAPSSTWCLPTASLELARTTLTRCIERAEGPGLVVGPAGMGKTLLCQVLAQHFRGKFHIATLASARLCTRRALLQNILFELKLPYRQMDESELRLSLVDHLEPKSGGGEGLLLLVDEAHTLPLRLLEEVRLITNLVRDGQPRVRLVLVGGMALEERLASPKLESFHQRIAARCYLQGMNREETQWYVTEQLRRAGAADPIFNYEALRAIHTATDGIPRLVNQLCDHALLLAALGGHLRLDQAGVEEAWSDLQQLPVPCHEPPRVTGGTSAGVIEFGQLADEPAGPQPAPDVGVAFQPTAAGNAEFCLETIESGLATLREEGPAANLAELPREEECDDFSPVAATGTEVEVVFHGDDPFGSGWEQEEVVIDRYAALENARLRRVASAEGREIGAAIAAVLDPPKPRLAAIPAEKAERQAAIVALADEPFDPASDPLLPDGVPVPTRRKAIVSLRDMTGDDRDLIVIEEEEKPSRTPPLAGKVRRSEYRQLFSTLRNRT